MTEELKKTDSELIKTLVNGYLQNHYKIELKDLDAWFGLSLCKFVTKIQNEDLDFLDITSSTSIQQIVNDLCELGQFKFDQYNFQPNDVVIDIGAHIGVFSILLAKKYPFLKIYSYEPIRTNYKNFTNNIEINKIPSGIIIPNRQALTGDSRNVSMIFNPEDSGAAEIGTTPRSKFLINPADKNIDSITLDKIFEINELKKVKLLKINCLGCEYEILQNCSKKNLRKIENLVGYFYQSPESNPEWDIKALIDLCECYIRNVQIIPMEKII